MFSLFTYNFIYIPLYKHFLQFFEMIMLISVSDVSNLYPKCTAMHKSNLLTVNVNTTWSNVSRAEKE